MHIAVLPLPLQGHLNPCLAIAKLLIPHGFTFTFVVTQELASKLALNLQEHDTQDVDPSSSQGSPIAYAAVPIDGAISAGDFSRTLEVLNSMRKGFEALLQKLLSSASGISCIIFDSFVTWGVQVAEQFSIPGFALFTTNAHTLALMRHIDVLMSKGLIPVQDPEEIIDCVPGLFPLKAGELSQSMRKYPSFVLNLTNSISKATGVVLNTVYELEEKPLHVIEKQVSIYTVGPMLLMLGSEQSKAGDKIGLWQEERECLVWLDSRASTSVLFVAFGSLATISHDQMQALAEGLEASGQAFLWVVRSDAVDGSLSEVLPDGFLERTKDRGLIISWAPQVEVLSHPAVGGFLTHCGWNSITENLSMGGVPMICWPQVAEQQINARLVVDEWKIGVKLQPTDGIVTAHVVEAAVRELMQGEERRELKRRAMKLKETVYIAVQEGGSSQNSLKVLAEDIRSCGSGVRASRQHNDGS